MFNTSIDTFETENNSPKRFLSRNCTKADIRHYASNEEYLEALGLAGWITIGLASVAMIFIIIIFIINLIYVHKNVSSKYTFSTSTVLSVYTGVGLCIYLQIIFPKANLVLDLASHIWLVVCMFQFFKLTIAYYGGETSFVRCLDGSVLPWRGLPCCCWPCVWPCLPSKEVHKGQVKLIKLLILQHPFIQAIFALITLTFYVEGWVLTSNSAFLDPYMYINIATVISFLFALWAFMVLLRSSGVKLAHYRYTGKVVSFKLCIFFVRFQNLIFTAILLPTGIFPCVRPVSPGVYANLILCSLVMGQLVVLSVSASHFFRVSEADKIDYKPKLEDEDSDKFLC